MNEEKKEPVIESFKDEADRAQFDATGLVDADPNKVYRWSRKKDINVARHKYNGYQVVDTTTDKVRSVLDDATKMKKGTDVSTSIEWADMVLMSTSKENHQKLLAARDAKIKRRTQGVSASFKRAAGRYSPSQFSAYEEHRDNKEMRGMSEKAFGKFLEEQRHEESRKR
jgi:hypothetical protein